MRFEYSVNKVKARPFLTVTGFLFFMPTIIFKMKYTKLIVVSLLAGQFDYNFSNAPIPQGAKVISIKNRNTGKTRGSKTIETAGGYGGLVIELKNQQTTIHEIPLASLLNRSTNGDCKGYQFDQPLDLTWGDVGTRIVSYDAANITTGNVVELEVEFIY